MKLALQLSCYNGGKYLPFLFASLKAQTKTDWHLFVLDNASDEENKLLIEQAVAGAGIPVALKRVEKNIGFAGAHSLLFAEHTKEYDAIQLLNDDAFLEPQFLELSFRYLESHPELGAVSGMILRWDFENRENGEQGKTNIIDTLGLDLSFTGAVKDRSAGKTLAEISLPKKPYQVFGVSGCLPMYRVSAVKAASPDGSLFDAAYRLYKEDVDLAYRLRAHHYLSAIVPSAIAYHRRSMRGKSGLALGSEKSGGENDYLSYRNHLWTLLKNLPVTSLFTSQIGVLPYETAKLFFWLTKRPSVVTQMMKDTRTRFTELMMWRRFGKDGRMRARATDVPVPSADIAIIIVSHNDLSPECLVSLQKARQATVRSTAVVVVDNASKKYAANELVAEYIPDAWTLLRPGDHGYGRSMNRGAKQVNAKYYFILNPDTSLPDVNIFTTLYEYIEAHPDVGLVGPRVQGFTGELHETCRRFPTWYQPFIQRTSLKNSALGKKYLYTFLMQDYDHTQEKAVDWVQGSAMFVNGDLWKTLKGFDDRFWLYFEDIDLCRRVWNAGKKVMYLPTVSISHLHGRQSAKIHNIFLNLVKTKESRGHLISWGKYLLKWLGKSAPQHE